MNQLTSESNIKLEIAVYAAQLQR